MVEEKVRYVNGKNCIMSMDDNDRREMEERKRRAYAQIQKDKRRQEQEYDKAVALMRLMNNNSQ
jgi:hypothetical protein